MNRAQLNFTRTSKSMLTIFFCSFPKALLVVGWDFDSHLKRRRSMEAKASTTASGSI